mmetsp:Transcript_52088/g.126271  ORF Transcript_52088/g.126271 Transcript_52088/m.126271 type:complete len:809 (+) Transcript_52088:450-2876(+)
MATRRAEMSLCSLASVSDSAASRFLSSCPSAASWLRSASDATLLLASRLARADPRSPDTLAVTSARSDDSRPPAARLSSATAWLVPSRSACRRAKRASSSRLCAACVAETLLSVATTRPCAPASPSRTAPTAPCSERSSAAVSFDRRARSPLMSTTSRANSSRAWSLSTPSVPRSSVLPAVSDCLIWSESAIQWSSSSLRSLASVSTSSCCVSCTCLYRSDERSDASLEASSTFCLACSTASCSSVSSLSCCLCIASMSARTSASRAAAARSPSSSRTLTESTPSVTTAPSSLLCSARLSVTFWLSCRSPESSRSPIVFLVTARLAADSARTLARRLSAASSMPLSLSTSSAASRLSLADTLRSARPRSWAASSLRVASPLRLERRCCVACSSRSTLAPTCEINSSACCTLPATSVPRALLCRDRRPKSASVRVETSESTVALWALVSFSRSSCAACIAEASPSASSDSMVLSPARRSRDTTVSAAVLPLTLDSSMACLDPSLVSEAFAPCTSDRRSLLLLPASRSTAARRDLTSRRSSCTSPATSRSSAAAVLLTLSASICVLSRISLLSSALSARRCAVTCALAALRRAFVVAIDSCRALTSSPVARSAASFSDRTTLSLSVSLASSPPTTLCASSIPACIPADWLPRSFFSACTDTCSFCSSAESLASAVAADWAIDSARLALRACTVLPTNELSLSTSASCSLPSLPLDASRSSRAAASLAASSCAPLVTSPTAARCTDLMRERLVDRPLSTVFSSSACAVRSTCWAVTASSPISTMREASSAARRWAAKEASSWSRLRACAVP